MSEPIIRQEAGVKVHESESPPIAGLKAGVLADIGTLILTTERLVFIKKGRTAKAAAFLVGGRLGGIVAKAVEDQVSKEALMNNQTMRAVSLYRFLASHVLKRIHVWEFLLSGLL